MRRHLDRFLGLWAFSHVFDGELIAVKKLSLPSLNDTKIRFGDSPSWRTFWFRLFVCFYHIHLWWHKFAADWEAFALKRCRRMSKTFIRKSADFFMLIDLFAQQDKCSLCLNFEIVAQKFLISWRCCVKIVSLNNSALVVRHYVMLFQ